MKHLVISRTELKMTCKTFEGHVTKGQGHMTRPSQFTFPSISPKPFNLHG